MSAGGQPVPWAGTVTTTRIGSKTVLAESFQTGVGWVNFPVYTFSGDLSAGSAACSAGAACARAWPPVLTSGEPGRTGVPASGVGETGIAGGLTQVTWNGRPLYLAFGGTFSLIVNP